MKKGNIQFNHEVKDLEVPNIYLELFAGQESIGFFVGDYLIQFFIHSRSGIAIKESVSDKFVFGPKVMYLFKTKIVKDTDKNSNTLLLWPLRFISEIAQLPST